MESLAVRIQRVHNFFNESGYYLVTSSGQQEAVDEVVKSGLLQRVKPEWFLPEHKSNDFYVHSSITCKNQMPVALFKRIVAFAPFRKNEIVELEMQTESGQEATILVRIAKEVKENRYEVVVLNTHVCLYVDAKELRRTFNEFE